MICQNFWPETNLCTTKCTGILVKFGNFVSKYNAQMQLLLQQYVPIMKVPPVLRHPTPQFTYNAVAFHASQPLRYDGAPYQEHSPICFFFILFTRHSPPWNVQFAMVKPWSIAVVTQIHELWGIILPAQRTDSLHAEHLDSHLFTHQTSMTTPPVPGRSISHTPSL